MNFPYQKRNNKSTNTAAQYVFVTLVQYLFLAVAKTISADFALE